MGVLKSFLVKSRKTWRRRMNVSLERKLVNDLFWYFSTFYTRNLSSDEMLHGRLIHRHGSALAGGLEESRRDTASVCCCSPLYTTKVLHYRSRLENHLTPSTLHQGTDGGTVFWEGNSARPESVSKLKPGSSCLLSYPKAFYTIMERSIVFLFVFCCCFFVCVLFNFLFWHNFRFMKESLRKYREGYLVHSVG